jgi:hypothetical protein
MIPAALETDLMCLLHYVQSILSISPVFTIADGGQSEFRASRRNTITITLQV